jgi:hypothetical protein
MAWKNLPYWLKGGICAVAIGIILAIITFTVLNLYPKDVMGLPIGPGGELFFALAVILTLPQIFMEYNLILNLVVSFIFYFLIGALIGWIVGKLRSKKKK